MMIFRYLPKFWNSLRRVLEAPEEKCAPRTIAPLEDAQAAREEYVAAFYRWHASGLLSDYEDAVRAWRVACAYDARLCAGIGEGIASDTVHPTVRA